VGRAPPGRAARRHARAGRVAHARRRGHDRAAGHLRGPGLGRGHSLGGEPAAGPADLRRRVAPLRPAGRGPLREPPGRPAHAGA
jgi:hypothetical protein